jgi:hypothetical protein
MGVAVVFTGGTIAMQRGPEAGGRYRPLQGGILEPTSGLEAMATVETIDWERCKHRISFAQLLDRTLPSDIARRRGRRWWIVVRAPTSSMRRPTRSTCWYPVPSHRGDRAMRPRRHGYDGR